MGRAARVIPVTTIGGYLGSGKTTLVNAMLGGAHGRRIGVLVNDFGAVSIDEKLIVARGEDVVTLVNGCACCAVAGDLGEALDRLASVNQPDHILIEASGVADPGVIAALAKSPGLTPRPPVVLAAADSIASRARDKFVGRLVRRQLAKAGLVVLTKTDIVDAEKQATARALVRREAPDAAIVEAVNGDIDIGLLLDRSAAFETSRFACDDGSDAAALFASETWSSLASLDPARVRAAVAALPRAFHRVKGVFADADGAHYSIQRANDQVELARLETEAGQMNADIVFIAPAGLLDPQALNSAMNACVDRPEPRE